MRYTVDMGVGNYARISSQGYQYIIMLTSSYCPLCTITLGRQTFVIILYVGVINFKQMFVEQ